ncbi:DUF1178 family protein [Novosphingobium sp.]|uniref:DUF1178 family protein n=1 Tax=Novosphingobium sp. TaxID=1874826 RepID=UPI0035AFD153
MIVFDLACDAGHRFEGWFASSDDFAGQQARGLVTCPECGSAEVTKAPMAPAVPRKGNQVAETRPQQAMVSAPLPPEAVEVLAKLAALQKEALKQSRWVGKDFAEQSREMHYGERDVETIHGQATLEEARDLLEEGVAVMPLPFPVAAPEDLN